MPTITTGRACGGCGACAGSAVRGPSARGVWTLRVWGWGRGWGLMVGGVVHCFRSVVEGVRPQAVNGVWAKAAGRASRCRSAAFPRRGQRGEPVGGGLGKNGGRGAGRSYPGCAQKLSTGCGFCGRRHGGVDDGGVGARCAAQTVENPAVLGIRLWTCPPDRLLSGTRRCARPLSTACGLPTPRRPAGPGRSPPGRPAGKASSAARRPGGESGDEIREVLRCRVHGPHVQTRCRT